MVVGFHDDIFQFITEVLLDGRLVFLFDFGVVGENADGVETFGIAAAFIGGEKFLHRIGSVGAVVQNLRQRGVTRANSSEGIAQHFHMFCECVALLAVPGDGSLELRGVLLQCAQPPGSGFKVVSGAVGIIARAHRGFEHVVLGGFKFAERFRLMNERFFGLLLFAMQTKETLAGFGGRAAQSFDARFSGGNLCRAGFGAICEFIHTCGDLA